ncbi:hypothetical protein SLS62_005124 [Diatrype stigma]|uniref:Metallo-beta-lactamase domain-containing protein n=1 Tax=Diatrype stigma TaxID=117547 RepID=A0AAN9UVI6_9PEZI
MTTAADTKASVFVTVSALDAGHLTLPERLFITDADPAKRNTVPSLSFLIQHPSPSPSRECGQTTNLVFDLGIKRDLDGYTAAQALHTAQRQPVITDPDCAASLRHGAGTARQKKQQSHSQSQSNNDEEEILIDPSKDIDLVIISHVHWDHIGTPSDFASATFTVGSGTQALLKNGAGHLYPAELFNADELPAARTVEFPPVPGATEYEAGSDIPKHTATPENTEAKLPRAASRWSWEPLGGFSNALDYFGDGSVYVIDSPGHLYGHVNLLTRVSESKYVYLGGDCCHDPRIMAGEKDIAMYGDGKGGLRSVHVDTNAAKRTLDRIRTFVKERDGEVEVEVVLAHDGVWRDQNLHRFWPGRL